MAAPTTFHAMVPGASTVRVAGCRNPTPWHTHAGAVMVLVDSGERTLATRETIQRVRAGAGAVIPARQAHAWAAVPPPGCCYRAIRIAAGPTDPMPAGIIADPAWREAFEAAYQAVANDPSRAVAAVAVLMAATRKRLPQAWRPPAEPGAVRRARSLLQSEDAFRMRLPELAHAAGMSAFHLHRLYRRLWGVTPAQHGLEARLRAAREAMLGGASVAAAAAAAGFCDQSHLTRAFHQFMGVPPERWRRQVTRCLRAEP